MIRKPVVNEELEAYTYNASEKYNYPVPPMEQIL